MAVNQLAQPGKGDLVAQMKTSKGTMKFRLFPEVAPKAVENFTTHARNGYYNDLIFHRVIADFMLQGGDPQGTGIGGKSIWGASFEDEFDVSARNYYGALSMANAGPNTNGSQFFIVQKKEVPASMLDQMKDLQDSGFPQEVIDNYRELGGTPWLDFKHTVFGQITQGQDVLDAIASVEVGFQDKPVEDVVIQSVTITEL
ncbi:MAG: peptidylprolyl isomerase [Clostridiales bacterium]|nr:peptidylprolyl isomerase [Clostridiales bacterium]